MPSRSFSAAWGKTKLSVLAPARPCDKKRGQSGLRLVQPSRAGASAPACVAYCYAFLDLPMDGTLLEAACRTCALSPLLAALSWAVRAIETASSFSLWITSAYFFHAMTISLAARAVFSSSCIRWDCSTAQIESTSPGAGTSSPPPPHVADKPVPQPSATAHAIKSITAPAVLKEWLKCRMMAVAIKKHTEHRNEANAWRVLLPCP